MPASKPIRLETASSDSCPCDPFLETLESRLLLSGPTFATPLSQGYSVPVPTAGSAYNTRVIGINGAAGTTSITATGGGPGLTVSVQNGAAYNYADLHFVQSDGTTVIGDIVFQLFDSQTAWTNSATAAQRFENLATQAVVNGQLASGTPFYSNVVVHRVISGFMIQTGDATKGDGTGGSGLGNLSDSFDPNLSFVGAGVVAMANTGSPNSSDCQFFVTVAPTTWLNGNYMIIGQVVSGWNVLNTIDNLPTGSNDKPTNPPIMKSVTIIHALNDATVTLQSQSTFTSSANVTITLKDAQGNTTPQTIEVANLISRAPISEQTIAPGASKTIQAQITPAAGISGLTMTYTAASSQSSATATINSATQQVTVTVPSSFSGLFSVTITATATGTGTFWSDPQVETVTFDVISQTADNPALESNTVDAAGGKVYKTVPYGHYVLAAAGTSGVLVYDVTNPGSPTNVSSYNTSNYAQDIVIVGQTAYVADTNGGLVALNIADPTNIHLLGTVATTGTAVGLSIDPTTNIAYVAETGTGLAEIDISNPASMSVLRYLKQITSSFSITNAQDVALKGTYAFVSDTAGGVAVLNIANPANVTLATAFGTYKAPTGLDIVGSTLYVADTYLIAYNISNLTKPMLLGYLNLTSATQVSVVNGTALVGTSTGLSIVDVTVPGKMSVQYTFAGTGFVGSSAVVGNNIAVAGGPDGLVMLQGVRTLTNQTVTFLDNNNVPVTVAIANGSVNVLTTGFKAGDIISLRFVSSSPTTTLTITTPSGKFTTAGDITDTAGSLKSLVAKTTDITGSIAILGSLETLTLHDMTGITQRTVTVSNDASVARKSNATLALTIHNVTDIGLNSQEPLSSLNLNNWTDTGANDEIDAPWVGTMTVAGALGANVVLNGAGGPRQTLTTAKVGAINNNSWKIQGDIGAITVTGGVLNWALTGDGVGNDLGVITSLTLPDVSGTTLASVGGIGTLKATRWLGGSIQANSLATLNITGATGIPGDFTASMTLAGASLLPTAKTLGTTTIKGNSGVSTWNITGNVGAITAGSATGLQLVSTGAAGTLNLGVVSGTSLNVGGVLAGVTAKSWSGGSISAASLTNLSVTAGDLNAAIALSGAGVSATGKTLGSVKSAGAIDGIWSVTGATGTIAAVSIPSTWNGTFGGNIASLSVSHDASGKLKAGSITTMSIMGKYGDGISGDTSLKLTQPLGGVKAALGSLSVGRWMDNVNVTSLDSLGAITAGGMTGSNVYAGVLNVDDALAPIASLNSAVLSPVSIASVTIKGITGAPASFVNTNLAGWNIGTLKLNMIQVANTPNGTFGVAANTIKSYTEQIGTKPYTWTPTVTKVWPSDTSADNGDYKVLKVV